MYERPNDDQPDFLSHFSAGLPDVPLIFPQPSDKGITYRENQENHGETPSDLPSITSTNEGTSSEIESIVPVDNSLSGGDGGVSEIGSQPPLEITADTPSADADDHQGLERQPMQIPEIEEPEKQQSNEPPNDQPPPQPPIGGEVPEEEPKEPVNALAEVATARDSREQLVRVYGEVTGELQAQIATVAEGIHQTLPVQEGSTMAVKEVIGLMASTTLKGVAPEISAATVDLAETFPDDTRLRALTYFAATVAGDLPTSIAASEKLQTLLEEEGRQLEWVGHAPGYKNQIANSPIHAVVAACAENDLPAETWIGQYSADPLHRAHLTMYYHNHRYALTRTPQSDDLAVQRLEEAVQTSLAFTEQTYNDVLQRLSTIPSINDPDLRKAVLRNYLALATKISADRSLSAKLVTLGTVLLAEPTTDAETIDLLDQAVLACDRPALKWNTTQDWKLALRMHRGANPTELIKFIDGSTAAALEAVRSAGVTPQAYSDLEMLIINFADQRFSRLVRHSVNNNDSANAARYLSHIQLYEERAQATVECLKLVTSREHLFRLLPLTGDYPGFTTLFQVAESVIDRDVSKLMEYATTIAREVTSETPSFPWELANSLKEYIIISLEHIDPLQAQQAEIIFQEADYAAQPQDYFYGDYAFRHGDYRGASRRLQRIKASPLPVIDRLKLTLILAEKLFTSKQEE